MGNIMHYQNRTVRLCAALTLVEMVIALAIMAIVFAAVFPGFRAIQKSWDSKADAAEVLQNGRVLMDHLYRNLSKAVQVTAVSNLGETNGYIEFEDNSGSILRYDIGADKYVEFGPVGDLSDLAGTVSQLQFTCYDAFDLERPLDTRMTDVSSIRSVKIQATLSNPSGLTQDKTFTAQVFLRANPDPESGDLVGWWKLDETSGTTASDSSVNGNHGTLIRMNPSRDWVLGKIEGALDFDGRNDRVEVPDDPSFDIADEITVAAWINPTDTRRWRTIISKFAHIRRYRKDLYWFLYNRRIGISLAGPCGSRGWDWRPDVRIPTDVWTHVALTYDGSTMIMYKNGISMATKSVSGTLKLADSTSDESFYIGRNTEWGEYFRGKIDDVRVYKRALSADEIAALSWEPPLVARWKLDETSGTTASDSSDNGNHGTLVHMHPGSDWVTGKVGGALDFDGWNDHVRVPDDPTFDIAHKITVIAWINPRDNRDWRTIVSKFAHAPWWRKDLYWFLYNRRIGASLAGPCGSRGWDWRPNVRISTDVWTHVALTYDGSAMTMYKNGDRAARRGVSGALMLAHPSSRESFYLGRNTEWGEYFQGKIDDVRVYNRALSDEQIEALYNGEELSELDGSTQILP